MGFGFVLLFSMSFDVKQFLIFRFFFHSLFQHVLPFISISMMGALILCSRIFFFFISRFKHIWCKKKKCVSKFCALIFRVFLDFFFRFGFVEKFLFHFASRSMGFFCCLCFAFIIWLSFYYSNHFATDAAFCLNFVKFWFCFLLSSHLIAFSFIQTIRLVFHHNSSGWFPFDYVPTE